MIPILSILIPTTPDRKESFDLLVQELERQIAGYSEGMIEIISDDTGKEMPIGEKRDLLYKRANGTFSVQWDSDDWISPNGIGLIIRHLTIGYNYIDGIGYQERCLINGVELLSNFSNKYDDWEGEGSFEFPDGFHYHRTLFFKTPIRTRICQEVGVNKTCRFGEDHDFARRVKPYIQNSVDIPAQIYHYIHNSKPEDHAIRYGFDKQ